MSLSSVSIRRPVLAIVLSLTILLFGAIGLSRLGVREFPSVDPPNITITTNYRGASAEVVESQITEPLEEALVREDGAILYPVRDGIPVMLIGESIALEAIHEA